MISKNDILRVLRRPSLVFCVLKGYRDRKWVERSEWFDADWYVKEFIDGNLSGLPPALHYSITGFHPDVLPCPDFVPAEYFSLHPEARGTNPLVHYEKKGKRKGYAISYLQKETGIPHRHVSLEEHQIALAQTAKRVRAKMERGEPLKTVFLVYSASMFPTRPLFDEMRKDSVFNPKIAVIPDLRWGNSTIETDMARIREDLGRSYPNEVFLDTRCDKHGEWPDVLSDSDIAVWNTPYSLSDFRYNPHWSVGRSFLPIHANYSYCITGKEWYMRIHNFGYFWKALFENEPNLMEYRQWSRIGGANGVLSGYVKMDALPVSQAKKGTERKRVLICPHHSIYADGHGAFTSSTFLRFSQFFMELPGEHPEIDFVFRPHPHLFYRLELVWGKRRTDEWRSHLLAHPNVSWSEGGDYFREFALADAIIQDCGSFLPEWLYTGKPGCYILRSDAPLEKEFSPFAIECLKHYYLAREQSEIENFISNVVLKGEDTLREARNYFLPTVTVNHPHVARFVVDDIKRSLAEA